MEKCVICGKDAIVRVNKDWLCEKKICHDQFFSIDKILEKAYDSTNKWFGGKNK